MASIKFPTFPSFDISKLDITKLDITKLDITKLDSTKLDSTAEAVTKAAKDAGYITVGLAVLAVQKAQVRRQELRKSLDDQVGSGTSQLAGIVDAVETGLAGLDARLVAIEARVDGAVDDLGKRLPERAGAVLGHAHEAVKVARQQVRTLITPAA